MGKEIEAVGRDRHLFHGAGKLLRQGRQVPVQIQTYVEFVFRNGFDVDQRSRQLKKVHKLWGWSRRVARR